MLSLKNRLRTQSTATAMKQSSEMMVSELRMNRRTAGSPRGMGNLRMCIVVAAQACCSAAVCMGKLSLPRISVPHSEQRRRGDKDVLSDGGGMSNAQWQMANVKWRSRSIHLPLSICHLPFDVSIHRRER